MKLDVIIPAAGAGKRMKAGVPKQYLKIGGRTILEITVGVFLDMPDVVGRIVVAVSPDDGRCRELGFARSPRVLFRAGGAERPHSVLSGLRGAGSEYVLVHDAARPCVSEEDVRALIAEGLTPDGAVLVAKVADTVKRAEGGLITGTVPRDDLRRALTPQLFRRDLLVAAYEKALAEGFVPTDESSAMERAGYRPKAVEGSAANIKVTEPADLRLAEFYLESRKRS